MSMSNKFQEVQEAMNERRSLEIAHSQQVQFERLTVSLVGDAEELSQLDKFADLEVGSVELTSLSNAVTHLQAFILKHRRKVAA